MPAMIALQQHRVLSGGIELAVFTAGEGPPVLLVHGFPDDHTVWDKQIPALVAAGYKVIAPDTRGCGASGIAPGVADYRIELLVADMIAVLDHFGVGTARLVGHDWGAIICWHLAIAHPRRIERYAALSVGHPGAFRTGGLRQMVKSYYVFVFQLRGIGEWLMRGRGWRTVRTMTGSASEGQAAVERLSRPGRLTAGINYYRANFGMFRRPALPKCPPMPVLGISSDGDPYLTERPMRETARFVAGPFRHVAIRGAGHWLQRDAPGEVNAALLAFLAPSAA